MEIFLVSFLIFTCVAMLLVLSQRARGGELPVGCTPESGTCCRARALGNCIGPATPECGSVKRWPVSTEQS